VWFASQFVPIGQNIGQSRVVVHLPEKPVYAAEQRGTFPAEALCYEENR
jgi:hypothetical protein